MDPLFVSCRRIAPRLAIVLMAGASLAACATAGPGRGPGFRPGRPEGTLQAPPPSAFLDRETGKPLRGTMKPYQVKGLWYYPGEQPDYDEVGIGSWYGEQFHNRQTSDGEMFDMDLLSAAHKTLPLPSLVEVTNLDNGRKMTVRVNDRGPFVEGRIIDLSRAAAEALGYKDKGIANVRVRYLGPAPGSPIPRQQIAAAGPPPPRPAPVAPRTVLTPMERFSIRREVRGETRGYRVQAGAFSSADNAQRAVDQIAGTEAAFIEPVDRQGSTLYRVVVGPAPDEAMAWALRDRVAALGFRDATILRP